MSCFTIRKVRSINLTKITLKSCGAFLRNKCHSDIVALITRLTNWITSCAFPFRTVYDRENRNACLISIHSYTSRFINFSTTFSIRRRKKLFEAHSCLNPAYCTKPRTHDTRQKQNRYLQRTEKKNPRTRITSTYLRVITFSKFGDVAIKARRGG